MERTIERPAISFPEWLALKGVAARNLPSDAERANLIGGCCFGSCRTKHAKGRLKGIARKVEYEAGLRREYEAELKDGRIATITEKVPLDLTREAGRAYLRAMEKRRLRGAT